MARAPVRAVLVADAILGLTVPVCVAAGRRSPPGQQVVTESLHGGGSVSGPSGVGPRANQGDWNRCWLRPEVSAGFVVKLMFPPGPPWGGAR